MLIFFKVKKPSHYTKLLSKNTVFLHKFQVDFVSLSLIRATLLV